MPTTLSNFPCTLSDNFRSKTIAGPLLPPTYIRNAPAISTTYNCWLCNFKNKCDSKIADVNAQQCGQCKRPRVPAWLLDSMGSDIRVGDVIHMALQRPAMFPEPCAERCAFVSCINYRDKHLEVVCLREQPPQPASRHEEGKHDAEPTDEDEHKSDPEAKFQDEQQEPGDQLETSAIQGELEQSPSFVAEKETISADVLARYHVQVVPTNDPRALLYRQYMLCGHCGNLSDLGPHHDVLATTSEINNKAGELRLLQQTIKENTKKLNYLKRRWKDRRTGYLEYVEANKEFLNLKKQQQVMEKAIQPLQFWCAYCGWEWKESAQFQKRLDARS